MKSEILMIQVWFLHKQVGNVIVAFPKKLVTYYILVKLLAYTKQVTIFN